MESWSRSMGSMTTLHSWPPSRQFSARRSPASSRRRSSSPPTACRRGSNLKAIARSGSRRALVCPIGFVADHLEILYDIDVEAMAFAREHGIELRRTASFNARPEFIDALAAVVSDALSGQSQPRGARIMER